MLSHMVFSIKLNLEYAKVLVADIPDQRMGEQPVAGQTMNHPAWVLGHLAVSSDDASRMLGGRTVCPEPWGKLFSAGTKPAANIVDYPDKATLLANLEASTQALIDALTNADAAQLTQPAPEHLVQWFPTVGDYVIFDTTAHVGTHLGQISAWRRALGLPSVLG